MRDHSVLVPMEGRRAIVGQTINDGLGSRTIEAMEKWTGNGIGRQVLYLPDDMSRQTITINIPFYTQEWPDLSCADIELEVLNLRTGTRTAFRGSFSIADESGVISN